MASGPEPVLFQILIIILAAKLGGEVAERLKQPAVLGELLMGILIGASLLGGYIGMPDFGLLQEEAHLHDEVVHNPGNDTLLAEFGHFIEQHGQAIASLEVLSALATIGVILLLFEVGLESDIKELTKVGASSLIVAFIGIVASFAVGYGASWALTSIWSSWASIDAAVGNNLLHMFVGATLTATSVGITARVLGDMGKLNSNETKIILGAAVIDDIGGLIILAIMGALITAAQAGTQVDALGLAWIAVKAIGFLVVSIVVGLRFLPQAYDGAVERFKVKGFPVALAIVFALAMAYTASLAGLADIVGAFAGGLILAQTRHAHRIFEDLRPIAAIFVSFFFVTLGMKVDLTQMRDATGASVVIPVLAVGVGMTLIAMAAKLACGWGVLKSANASKLVVGVGMAPRGEVGLIFAALGLSLGFIANWQYTTIILVVMLTTFITPIWLGRLQDKFIGDRDDHDPKAEAMSKMLEA